jgi:hypothetical protein
MRPRLSFPNFSRETENPIATRFGLSRTADRGFPASPVKFGLKTDFACFF